VKLVFSPHSLRQLHEIQAYIAYDSPTAAAKVVTRIRQSIEMLADFPKLGRIWEGRADARSDGLRRALSHTGCSRKRGRGNPARNAHQPETARPLARISHRV
jgi:plasmid stabilization system protein ParE